MKLVVTEKNIAAQKIAELLGVTKAKADKVYSTPVYRFERDGEEWVTIGMRGHILEPNFVPQLIYKKEGDGLVLMLMVLQFPHRFLMIYRNLLSRKRSLLFPKV